ncbi:hypothetical protein SPF06_18160 [Sinomonas sp. JGH33]|uniref:Calcineurin-like phosphoesterase domain-containing protein n=1 Tax=Sinomonas terricola TaxID=3110330 RepID=A0ABU5TAG4_9MICC|nr:hypothetical protein [Sinomonas sp. JGH33]MEA5456652.1 hypothetical protein [Sinomonas sp. JGH33]
MKLKELAAHSAELGFTPQQAVRWLAPVSLSRTALKVAAATLFAAFGDKRELEGALPGPPLLLDRLPLPGRPAQPIDGEPGVGLPQTEDETAPAPRIVRREGEDLWLDFAADLGDGFDATYSIALLLAQDALDVDGTQLPRGAVLVLGGDEVYPVASAKGYEDRTVGPYSAAFPFSPHRVLADSCPPASVMIALPGNHDWYDGLTSFLRVFTRQHSIGGWRTIQSRSYFGLRLTGGRGHPGWWLVGLDSQLGQYIDEPQLEYFYNNVTTKLQPGDAIILCLASPYWVHATTPTADEFRQIDFFEQDYLRRRFNPETGLFEETGASVRLWLSGDHHHYSRFESAGSAEAGHGGPEPGEPEQLVTCGLGGAYLAETTWVPRELALPAPITAPVSASVLPSGGRGARDGDTRRFVRTSALYPDDDECPRLVRRLANPFSRFWLPIRNPGFGPLLGLWHAVAFLILWAVASGLRGESLLGNLEGMAHDGVPATAIVGVGIPLAALGILAIVTGALDRGRGAVLTCARCVLFQIAALGLSATIVLLVTGLAGLPGPVAGPLALVIVFLGGWTFGSEGFALFIIGTKGPSGVASWAMSGQAVEDHKGFLRIRLAPDGTATVYPLVADTVCHEWDLEPDGAGARPVPSGGLPRLRLLEDPITVAREATQEPRAAREGAKPWASPAQTTRRASSRSDHETTAPSASSM